MARRQHAVQRPVPRLDLDKEHASRAPEQGTRRYTDRVTGRDRESLTVRLDPRVVLVCLPEHVERRVTLEWHRVAIAGVNDRTYPRLGRGESHAPHMEMIQVHPQHTP